MKDEDDVHDEVRLPDSGIRVAAEGAGSLVTLWGEVDATLRDEASLVMVQVMDRGGPVVIRTSDVTFIDSCGLAFVLQLHRLAAESGQHVVLRDPAPLVLELLELIGVRERLVVEPSLDALLDEDAVPDDVGGGSSVPDLTSTGA